MKTMLHATTALVTSGLVLATGAALAEQEDEQKVQIGIEGYFQQWGVAANQDVDGVDGLDVDTSPLGSVEIQDSIPRLFVIQAWDGTICTDRRPMGENGAALSGQADGPRA
jgi:hypothetical protein